MAVIFGNRSRILGRRLVQLAAEMNISNDRVFDLQIALIAFENGATEIWSHDMNFVTVPGLRVINPRDH